MKIHVYLRIFVVEHLARPLGIDRQSPDLAGICLIPEMELSKRLIRIAVGKDSLAPSKEKGAI